MSHKIPSPVPGGIRFINETESIITGTGDYGIKRIGGGLESDTSDNENENGKREHSLSGPKPGKKTRGRVKIEMRFIENKLRRYTTFSKRKTGIMKKAFELSTLTGTQVMLLVASETGHVYTFATRKLQPMITSESGKALIQTCLNSPDGSGALTAAASPGDVRMNPVGFEEPELSYAVDEESDSSQSNVIRPLNIAPTSSATGSSLFINSVNSASPSPVPMEAQRKDQQPPQNSQLSPLEPMQLTTTSSGNVSQNSTPKPESAALKSNNVAVQLPQGVVFSQPGYPGTPIAVAAPGGSNQALYRIQGPGGQSQMVAMAGIAASPAPAHQPPATSNNNNNKPKENANTSTAQVPTPVAIVPGTSNAGYVYQMPQGLMYAASSGLPEGYMLSIPQTPTLAIPQQAQEGQGGTPTQQYIFQLPVSPATGQPQLIQPILAPQAPAAAKVEKK